MFHGKKIMVPIDFTPVTYNALMYANAFARIFKNDILLMHVADKKSHETAVKKIAEMADTNKQEDMETSYTVVDGNIFDHIGQTAAEHAVSLVVMGTHGIKGAQKYFGSHAMKVITHSKVPYIVCQNKPFETIKNILIPVDFSVEVKQTLIFSEAIARQFNATIHLLPKVVADEWLVKKVNLNMRYARTYLQENKIEVNVITEHLDKDFVQDTVKNAIAKQCGLIVTIVDPETGITDYLTGSYEQKIIANEAQIPVMCVNMKTVIIYSHGAPTKG